MRKFKKHSCGQRLRLLGTRVETNTKIVRDGLMPKRVKTDTVITMRWCPRCTRALRRKAQLKWRSLYRSLSHGEQLMMAVHIPQPCETPLRTMAVS